MDGGEKTQYYAEAGPEEWMIHRITVCCDILKELRINVGSPHTLLPSQANAPWSCCMFFFLRQHSLKSSFLSVNIFLFCVLYLLSIAGTDCNPCSIHLHLLCCWQNPEFPQASGPAAGGNVWLVQTVIIYPGWSLKSPEEFFKQCWHLGYTPRHSDLIGLEWVLKTPIWLKCASKIEICCSKDPLEI